MYKKEDENITEQVNLKWKGEFKKSINKTHKKFEAFLPSQKFLAYSTKDNNFNIRFENKEELIKISDVLRANNED
ncbi:hypothetical protein [Wolbachia endosymbiont of Brugia pahangi]|uniref:hypothetical protein n=1 Tax=Wolbachia endosymbiont of Brugia pahangi TaxID=96495 RepID=UPI0014359BAA|nr:hypothetical protein [Wolbachia endosymbiont of Brugia pahangi]QIT35924.1 hypothetical protein WBP_0240 [Wolbachia endosymbiont of Brugia pahangi]